MWRAPLLHSLSLRVRMAGSASAENGRFLYYSYGSNMSTERIHKNCEIADFVSIAHLPRHVVKFAPRSKRWHGATATIVAQEGSGDKEACTWGVLWAIPSSYLDALDRQESGMKRVEVEVTKDPSGEQVTCYTYIVVSPPPDALPSPQYLATVVRGAREHGLPAWYIKKLEEVGDNGYHGEVQPP